MAEVQQLVQEFRAQPFKHDPDLRLHFVERIKGLGETLRHAAETCYGLGLTAGWWHDLKNNGAPVDKRSFGDLCSLFHSEISEAFEAFRKGDAMDDKLKHRKGRVAELVDLQVRLFDYVASEPELLKEFLETFEEKLMYNVTRKDHQIENRLAAGGKQL